MADNTQIYNAETRTKLSEAIEAFGKKLQDAVHIDHSPENQEREGYLGDPAIDAVAANALLGTPNQEGQMAKDFRQVKSVYEAWLSGATSSIVPLKYALDEYLGKYEMIGGESLEHIYDALTATQEMHKTELALASHAGKKKHRNSLHSRDRPVQDKTRSH